MWDREAAAGEKTSELGMLRARQQASIAQGQREEQGGRDGAFELKRATQ